MGRIRKVASLVILSFVLSTPLYANMPVIDISAIAQGITQFMTTVEQYSRQIQQWKSEYDKMVKAAKAIASGDFNEIMSGIASFANQFASWDSTNKYADSFLKNIGNAAKLSSTINDMSQNMGETLGNAWNWVSSIEDADDIWSGLETAGDVVGDAASSMSKVASTVGRFTGKISDLGVTMAAIGTQLENGALGVSDEELEEAEQAYQDAITAENEAYTEYQNALNSASDANDISIKQLEDAYKQAQEQTLAKKEQLDTQRQNREEILSALSDAQMQVDERLAEMSMSIGNDLNDAEISSAIDNFAAGTKFGSFK